MTTSTTYTPSTDFRGIIPVEITDEQVNRAEKILKDGTDENWNIKDFGFKVIGVTGAKQVYYTFWKFNPRSIYNQLVFLGNLSTDIVEAAKKAKKYSGIQPIFFENYDTLIGLKGSPVDVLTFGKNRGRTIGEVYIEDPQYIIWLSKNMNPRNNKQQKQLELAQELTKDYFDQMAKVNRKNDNMEYYGEEKEKIDLPVKITFVKVTGYNIDVSSSLKIRAEYEGKYRFEFYINNITKLEELFNVNGIAEVIKVLAELNDKKLRIVGKIKRHKEILGKKYTQLHYVKILNE